MVYWSAAYGGAETFGLSLMRSFRRREVDVAVVFICRGGPLETRLDDERISYTIVDVDRGSDLLARPWRLARVLKAFQADAVILPSSGFLVAATRIAGFRGPVVAVEHGDVLGLPKLGALRRARQHVDRLVGAPFVSETVAVSEYVRRAVERLPHFARVTTIPNGVDLGLFSPASSERRHDIFRIGAAARLIPGKGVDVLISALSLLSPQRAWECVIAGDGPDRDRLELLAQRSGASNRIRFSGWVGHMAEFWRSCDVAVVPSFEFIESFGMTALEAMACGIPVVASRNGGLTEVVPDGTAGILVDAGNAMAMATAIQKYVDDPEVGRAHGVRARSHCEASFDVCDRADRYIGLLGW